MGIKNSGSAESIRPVQLGKGDKQFGEESIYWLLMTCSKLTAELSSPFIYSGGYFQTPGFSWVGDSMNSMGSHPKQAQPLKMMGFKWEVKQSEN